ncbi:MAG: transcription antitermination factor NusB [Oscillospiraceae bacterium]|jgi:N utilization substance protein B
MTRRQMRENCFILLFERAFTEYTVDELFALAAECDEVTLNSTVKSYYIGISENLETIDSLIEAHLKNWNLARISKVALSLLRLAVYEICIVKEVEPAIAINEAIEIAKIYSTQEDANYINGVLGSVVRDMEPEKQAEEVAAE